VNRTYLPHEFAKRAGVTIRALHHYDRLGLLKTSGRTAAGYRVYSDRDFARLEQIVALKFIGFPLFQIRELLRRKDTDLTSALRQQRQILAEKRDHFDRAMRAIERAENVVAPGGKPDWEPFRKVIEVIHMQTRKDWMKNSILRTNSRISASVGRPTCRRNRKAVGLLWLETQRRPARAA
jgi:DNA-binding transcriptional MerR regulator